MKFICYILFACWFSTLHAQNPAPQSIPCTEVVGDVVSNYPPMIANVNCIRIGDTPETTTVTGNQQVSFKAGNEIHIKTATHFKPDEGGSVHLFIQKSNVQAAWFEPQEGVHAVKKYHKLEMGFNLSHYVNTEIETFLANDSEGLNPFDPDVISLNAVFTSPSGAVKTRHGFYYKPYLRDLVSNTWTADTTSYPWRLRFAPDETGKWKVQVTVVVNGNPVGAPMDFSFICIPSSHKGYVSRSYNGDESDRYLYLSETGEPFFTIGHNIAHSDYIALTPESSVRHQQWLAELADNGGNFYRLELGAQNALPDWNNYKNYSSKMAEMWEYDELMELSHTLQLYFILFRHHAELIYNEWPNYWQENPYRIGFGLESFTAYFSSPEVMKWQKKCLRYIFSRWGYNPNFSFYEHSEVDHFVETMVETEGIPYSSTLNHFMNWDKAQIPYYKDTLGYNKIMKINTYAVYKNGGNHEINNKGTAVFSYVDVVGLHQYSIYKDANWNRFDEAEEIWKHWKKPIILEETGVTPDHIKLYCCTDIEFHNTIWATSFMGCTGTGMHWWWDRGIHDYGYEQGYRNITVFFEGENVRTAHYTPQKWSDVSNSKHEKAKIETYLLKSGDRQRVLGWLHNATYFWRNLENSNSCIQELVVNNDFVTPCVMNDGYVMHSPGADKKFEKSDYKDNYTDQGGTQPIHNSPNIEHNPKFKIAGMKYNVGWKHHWYKVEFFTTRGYPNAIPLPTATQVLHANVFFNLKPHVPNLYDYNPDYAYKVTYLGKSRKPPAGSNLPTMLPEYEAQNGAEKTMQESEVNTEQADVPRNSERSENSTEINLFPNPNSGAFTVRSELLIEKVEVFDTHGSLVFSEENPGNSSHEIMLNQKDKGIFIVRIQTSQQITNKRIIVL